MVIDCELFARVSSILSYLSGAPIRIGFHRYTQEGLYRGSFLNRPVLYNPYRHISLQLLTLAAAIESTTVPTGKTAALRPRTARERGTSGKGSRGEDREAARRLPALRDKSLVLIYASGGILPIRAWPLDSFKRLCTEACSKTATRSGSSASNRTSLSEIPSSRIAETPAVSISAATPIPCAIYSRFFIAPLFSSPTTERPGNSPPSHPCPPSFCLARRLPPSMVRSLQKCIPCTSSCRVHRA